MQNPSSRLIPLPWRPCSPGVAEHRFSSRALQSLTEQDDFLRPLNPGAARQVMLEIDRACAMIAEFPFVGRAVPETRLRCHITRKFRYRIIYTVAGSGVEIRDILHPRQG
jgi:plasmid stabilization system protein ParE